MSRLAVAGLFAALSSLAFAGESPVPGALNPDVTQETIGKTICIAGWTRSIRPPVVYTNRIKHRLMAEAKIPWSRHAEYELDHAVPLTLGGDPWSPKNLWLQHWDGPAGAHAKDWLEVELNHRVCRGAMLLDTARGLIWPDWLAAYRQLFLHD